ncbi:MAG: hypothetical protein Q7T40_02345 [Methylobacter sp.]|nr:hypothetical protein [Methylobacter sp.]MDO9423019.1 hypothetical protein [Methylobacter sp.]
MNKTKVILISKRLQQTKKARHTHREAGIQSYGWQASIHPWSLDSGTNPSGTDLHLPEGLRAGQPGVNPCRNDDAAAQWLRAS